MSENLAEAVRPSYEQIVQAIKHSGVREILRHALENEQRLGRELETVDRLLVLGYGPRFIAARWGIPRHRIKLHRDECLVGERRRAAEADLQRIVEKTGGVR